MLDASVRGEILKLLVELKDEFGMTLVLITHDLAFAWAIADRVAIMYLGKIVEVGPSEKVLTDPLHPYTKSLLAVTPEVGRRMSHEVLTGEPPDPANIPSGCRFHPRCPVLRSGEAGSQEPRCLAEVPILEEPVAGPSSSLPRRDGRERPLSIISAGQQFSRSAIQRFLFRPCPAACEAPAF